MSSSPTLSGLTAETETYPLLTENQVARLRPSSLWMLGHAEVTRENSNPDLRTHWQE
jgi:hypothetical protein